jgi:hydrogenase nickel incorporation protein HypB
VITKSDLAIATEFDWVTAESNIQSVRPGIRVFRLSAKTGEGMAEFIDFLQSRRSAAIASA